jgi:uridine phosphorylase
MTYPILEFDPAPEAFIEPSRVIAPRDVPEHCVICFFRDVVEKVAAGRQARIAVDSHWEDGPHPIYEIAFNKRRLAFFQPGVGAALSAGLLEEAIAYGCRKFIVCGGCGVLQPDIAVGHLILVTAALRDEGVSYHYLPPAREISAGGTAAGETALNALTATLDRHALPYRAGKTWTTDAPYRETPAKIARSRAEGCLAVDMEAAALLAVAQFRGVALAQLLYGGDHLSGSTWDKRAWQSRDEIRESLFWLCAEACLEM